MDSDFTLVTGATSDIGTAICRRLAPARRLLLHGRDPARLESLHRGLPNPEVHVVWQLDLGQPGQIRDSLDSCLRRQRAEVVALVHAAGSFQPAPLRVLDAEAVHAVFCIHVFSAMEILRTAASRRINSEKLAAAVFISSIAADLGVAGYGAYAAAKGALKSFCRSMAVELAPRVRVNCVSPGGINTRGNRHLRTATDAPPTPPREYPLGPGTCEDIAGAVAFLLSPDARWITGQDLVVDGGRILR